MIRPTILSLACFSLIQAYSFDFSTTDVQNAKLDAATLGAQFKSGYANKDALQSKALDTMTSDKQITTMDGNKSATANLTCSEIASYFAEITYTGTSDITLNVKLDYDQDGTIDKNINYGGISGIFAAGVAVCDADTFTNCTTYKWDFNTATNEPMFTQIHPMQAGGLYCINSSCQSIAATQKRRILEDVTGPLSAVLQSANSSLVVSKVEYQNDTVYLYGQNYQNCKNVEDDNATFTASSSIPSGSALTNMGTTAMASSSNFTLLTEIDANEQANPISASDKAELEKIATDATQATPSTDGTTVNYTNRYKDKDGNWIVRADSSSMIVDPIPQAKSCMVEFEEVRTIVASDGKVIGNTGNQSDGVGVQLATEIRECTGVDYSVCPVQINETIKYDCGNLEASMGESMAAMQAAQEMAKDFTCSTN